MGETPPCCSKEMLSPSKLERKTKGTLPHWAAGVREEGTADPDTGQGFVVWPQAGQGSAGKDAFGTVCGPLTFLWIL